MELEKNYPYSLLENYKYSGETEITLDASDYLRPIKALTTGGISPKAYAVTNLNLDYNGVTDNKIKRMKSYLSKGLSIVASMYGSSS